jgi:ABC-type sugar transport system permease subunit
MALRNNRRKKTGPQKSATPWLRFKESLAAYPFIAPFFLGFIIFQLLPICFSITLSFAQWNGMSAIQFSGVQNFIDMFHDAKFWNALRVTFIITIFCTIVGTIGAMALAVLLEKVEDRFASILRVFFFLPSVTSVVVIGYIWKQLYSSDYGFFNSILVQVGLPAQDWLTNPKLALPALLVMLIWAGLGWDALIITSGLRSIPDELYDAGRVDGTNGWSEFRYITLPLLQPTLLFILVTSVIFLWGIFAQPSVLTGGGPLRQTQTIAMYLYDVGFRYHKFGYASAIAVILSLIMFVSSYLNFRFVKSDSEY